MHHVFLYQCDHCSGLIAYCVIRMKSGYIYAIDGRRWRRRFCRIAKHTSEFVISICNIHCNNNQKGLHIFVYVYLSAALFLVEFEAFSIHIFLQHVSSISECTHKHYIFIFIIIYLWKYWHCDHIFFLSHCSTIASTHGFGRKECLFLHEIWILYSYLF